MKKLLALAAAAAMLSFTWAGVAHADGGGPTSINLTAGSLTVTGAAPDNFSNFALTGSTTTVHTGIGTMNVTDATGASAGWHVDASTGGASLVDTSSDTLGALIIHGATGACTVGAGCDATTITPSSGELDTNPSVTIESATSPAGGSFDFTFPAQALDLTIPGNAKAGTYSATLTVTVSSSP